MAFASTNVNDQNLTAELAGQTVRKTYKGLGLIPRITNGGGYGLSQARPSDRGPQNYTQGNPLARAKRKCSLAMGLPPRAAI
jgi:hypothetical protein